MNSYQVLSLRKIKTNYGSYHSAFSTLYKRLRDPWSGICYSAEAPGSGSLSEWWVASACLASDGLTNCRISPSRLCVLCSYSLPHHGDYNFSIFMKMMLNKKLSPIVVMEVKKAKKRKKKDDILELEGLESDASWMPGAHALCGMMIYGNTDLCCALCIFLLPSY